MPSSGKDGLHYGHRHRRARGINRRALREIVLSGRVAPLLMSATNEAYGRYGVSLDQSRLRFTLS